MSDKMSDDVVHVKIRVKTGVNDNAVIADFDHRIFRYGRKVKLTAITGFRRLDMKAINDFVDVDILEGCLLGVVSAILDLNRAPNSGIKRIVVDSHTIKIVFSHAVDPGKLCPTVREAIFGIPDQNFVLVA